MSTGIWIHSKVKVICQDTGKTLIEGDLLSITVSQRADGSRSFDVKAQCNRVSTTQSQNPSDGWVEKKPERCEHKYRPYQGLVETYEYCELCGEKKQA